MAVATVNGPQWTTDQIATGLVRHGFTGWQVVTMGAICQAESRGYIWITGLNTTDPTSPTYLTVDVGLFQLNEYWATLMLSPALLERVLMLSRKYKEGRSFGQLARDPEWNLAAARDMYLIGVLSYGYTNAYNIWNTYKNGLHRPYLAEAKAAAVRAGVKL